MHLQIAVLKETFAICKLDQDSDVPPWIKKSEFYSVTRTSDELSIVCKQSLIKDSLGQVSRNWSVLKIIGPLDFSIVGIIAHISDILKNKNIAIFTVSTYETDYILVKNSDLAISKEALIACGHTIISDEE